jgi:hypothetical protein
VDPTWIILLLFIVFIALLVLLFRSSKQALAHTVVESPRSPEEVAEIVKGAFSGVRQTLWTSASGPGTINLRRRGKDGGITMSIDISPSGKGGSVIEMWASTYNEYFFVFANFSGAVNSRKRAISRLVTA